MKIFTNQLGYLPNGSKYVVASKKAVKFVVIDDLNGKIVYKGKMWRRKDPTSEKIIWTGDFTAVETPGTYRIEIQGLGSSYLFSVNKNIYNILLRQSMRFYYLQRCGIALNDEETGLKHPPCHHEDARITRKDDFHAENEHVKSKGGWHDAGDYGKYATTTAYTIAVMLSAYELWPERYNDGQFGIPESGNGIPDILDEARVGIEWLLTMQRPDGAVYHKIAGGSFAGFESPELDMQTRYLYGINTNDTAKLAAAMSIAARVYLEWDPGFSIRLKEAAYKAWDFLSNNNYLWDYKDSDNNGSGPYGLGHDRYDRLWAALEFTTLTGDDRFLINMNEILKEYQPSAPDWKESAIFGLFHYARSNLIKPHIKRIISAKVINAAKKYLKISESSGYRYTLNFEDFKWGSNDHGLSRGITMVLANILSPNHSLTTAALAQLDFILGLNPLAKCYVAGIGSDSVKNPHHRFVAVSKKTIPGLLAGGPNNKAQSGIEPVDSGPFSYIDAEASYSSNEPALNYNASLVFMATAFLKF